MTKCPLCGRWVESAHACSRVKPPSKTPTEQDADRAGAAQARRASALRRPKPPRRRMVTNPLPWKPTVPEVLPIVRKLYRRDPAGCCWHVVLDDGNIEDDFVFRSCERIADGGPEGDAMRHDECVALAGLLPLMSRTQRRKLSRMAGA